MSIEQINESEHKLLMLKRADKARAGRLGGPAAAAVRAERRAAIAELKQALDSNARTPGQRALARITLAAYGQILALTNHTGKRQRDIRGISALISGCEANLVKLGALPESTTAPPSGTESGAQPGDRPEPRKALYCACESGNPEPCELCKARSAARAAKAAEGAAQ
jgi:hypothetical protein